MNIIAKLTYYSLLFANLSMFANLNAAEVNKIEQESSVDCMLFRDNVMSSNQFTLTEKDRMISSTNLSHNLTWENDAFASGGDRHYTNGMKLAWKHNPCRGENEWIKDIVSRNFSSPDFDIETNPINKIISTGGAFGMNMYTPTDISRTDRIYEDRPYMGWMYYATQVQVAGRLLDNKSWTDKSVQSLELQFGVLGPVAAQEYFQTWVHDEVTDSKTPMGWDNQADNRLGINALYAYRKNHFLGEKPSDNYKLTSHVGFSVGNVMNFVNAGVVLSMGRVGQDYPSGPLLPSKHSALLEDKKIQTKDAHGIVQEMPTQQYSRHNLFYVFTGVDYRYIESSVFIEGYGQSQHDIELINNVYDLFAGVAYKSEGCKFTYKVIQRSKEFDSSVSELEQSHKFGQLEFEWYF